MRYHRFVDLPVWQAARQYKLAIYRLCGSGELARHKEPRDQLRSAVAKPPALIAEAYGRFNPLDSARILTQAKAELLESQNHLVDAFDKQFITEAVRLEHHKMAQEVVGQVDGWRDYLQSEEAQRKVKEIRERRKRNRNSNRNKNQNENPEPESE